MQAWVVHGAADGLELGAAARAEGLPAAALGEPAGGGGPPEDEEVAAEQPERAVIAAMTSGGAYLSLIGEPSPSAVPGYRAPGVKTRRGGERCTGGRS